MRAPTRQLLETRLAGMPGRPGVIQYENAISELPPDLCLRATLLPADTYPTDILGARGDGSGAVFQVMDGEFQVDVFARAATAQVQGPAEADAMADLVADRFRPGLRLTATGVTVQIDRTRSYPAVPGVPRYQVPVRVRFRAQNRG